MRHVLYGGFGADTWVNNRRARVWSNLAVGAEVVFRRGDLPASWSVFLAESDHNFWQSDRIWSGGYGSEVVDTLEQWRQRTDLGEGSVQGDAGLTADWRLPAHSPARGVARGGVNTRALSSGVERVGPTW